MYQIGDLICSNVFGDEQHYGIIKEISTDDLVSPINLDKPRIIYFITWFEEDIFPDYVYDREIKLVY